VTAGAPPAGARRITVQIDPDAQARILAANPAVPPRPEQPRDPGGATSGSGPGPRAAAGGAYGWYWDHVSPARAAASSGRLDAAVAATRRGPGGSGVTAPRLATLQRIADAHGARLLAATAGRGVSPALALAVIAVESAGRVDAVSSAGAGGLMQLMPATAERFGVADRMDPKANIEGGVAYLEWLLERFDRDVVLALAGYNAGEGAVDTHGGVPPFAETRDYVPKVLAAWDLARGLCLTPPQLVSDGCVFRQGVAVARGE
jgi:soluble lytic murein transglycosylase-like protein